MQIFLRIPGTVVYLPGMTMQFNTRESGTGIPGNLTLSVMETSDEKLSRIKIGTDNKDRN